MITGSIPTNSGSPGCGLRDVPLIPEGEQRRCWIIPISNWLTFSITRESPRRPSENAYTLDTRVQSHRSYLPRKWYHFVPRSSIQSFSFTLRRSAMAQWLQAPADGSPNHPVRGGAQTDQVTFSRTPRTPPARHHTIQTRRTPNQPPQPSQLQFVERYRTYIQ